MSMTSESDERIIPDNSIGSPYSDDANSKGANAGINGTLKKGPWTSAEDAILIEYVTKYGEGNWNAVQKHSGLARCGKSCRLRWANHLRPDLKKGAFTPEEERHIIELHAKMGNKWARMAIELPGRTDNEIKNFWNTRIKRRQRAGLPIYPPDICLQASNNPQTDDTSILSPTGMPQPDFMPVNDFIKIPSVEFKGLELDNQFYPQSLIDINPSGANFLDIPSSSLLSQGFNSSCHNKALLSTLHQSKRLRGSESPFHTPIGNTFTDGSRLYQSDCPVQISKSFAFSQYDHHNPASNYLHHTATTPNVYELPSLQIQTCNVGSPSFPLPLFEPVDVLIQTPPNGDASSSHLSPQNSGLLEEVLYESETLKNSNSNAFGQPSGVYNNIGNNVVENSARGFHETKWEVYDEEASYLGRSPSSVFSGSTPITPMSGNSLDEPCSAENMPVNELAGSLDQMQYDDNKVEITFSRPDYLLASNSVGPMRCPTTNDHSLLENAMGKLLGDDLSRDCKQMDMGCPSSPGRGPGHDTCAWSAMPTI
ncbi:hypothetical protein OROGR_002678 [Orobanche gracilis]